MKRAILYTLFSLFLFLLPTRHATASGNDSIRLSLLTCAPGEELYSLFGHTAIRYENLPQRIDVVFNYGLFSFNTPNFALRFALGETDYQLGVTEYQNFAAEYAFYDRSVWQQTLRLNGEEKVKLVQLLEENYRPENRIYRYNFFFDNCATRPRDVIEESVTGKVVYPTEPKDSSQTFRDIVHQCCEGHPWSRFGIDLCIGSEADRPITQRLMMFAPNYLKGAFANAKIINGIEKKPLVCATEKVVHATPEIEKENWRLTPLGCMILVFIITAATTIYGIKHKKGLWGIDLVLFGITGIAGCILAFLALFSQHPAVSANYLLFVFHPGQLFFLPYIIYCVRKRKKCWYLTLNFISLTLFMALFWLIPQRIDFAVVPLALSLLIRSASNLILTYKKN